MPMDLQRISRWTIVSERNRELAWVTLEKDGKINVQQSVVMLDSFSARELAKVLIAAADEADEAASEMKGIHGNRGL